MRLTVQDFYTLVGASSITHHHHAVLTLVRVMSACLMASAETQPQKGTVVSAVWMTHEPSNGLSRRDYNLAVICDLIAGVVSNDKGVWAQIVAKVPEDNKWRTREQISDRNVPPMLRFKHNSYAPVKLMLLTIRG